MVTLTEKDSLYIGYEKKYGCGNLRKCINGKVTGCSNCVGYCRFKGHPGFLTAGLCKQHDCIGKQCFYYISKPKKQKVVKTDASKNILDLVNPYMADYQGLKIIRAEQGQNDTWQCFYIAITNAYSEDVIESSLRLALSHPVKLTRLNYDFDKCVQLFMRA